MMTMITMAMTTGMNDTLMAPLGMRDVRNNDDNNDKGSFSDNFVVLLAKVTLRRRLWMLFCERFYLMTLMTMMVIRA